jgi:hypothetical protein
MSWPDLNVQLAPAVIGLAFVAALGAYLIAGNLGLLGRIKLPRWGRGVSIEDAYSSQTGDASDDRITMLDSQPVLDRAFGPIVRSLVAALPHKDDAWVAQSLDLLAYPGALKTIADFYALQVIYALIGFGLGITLGLYELANGSDALGLFFWTAMFSIAGYALPKLHLRSQLKQRRDAMLFEAPYVFDQLATAILANSGLVNGVKALVNQAEDAARRAARQAQMRNGTGNGAASQRDPFASMSDEERLNEINARRVIGLRSALLSATSIPEGSYLMRELRLVSDRYSQQQDITDCLQAMAERNADVPLIERFCQRIASASRRGLDTSEALQELGNRAADMVEDMIEERGTVNTTLMIAPTVLSLVGIVVVLIAPLAFGPSLGFF